MILERLKAKYYFSIAIYLMAVILMAVTIVLCAVGQSFVSMENKLLKGLIFYGLIVAVGLAELYFIYAFIKCCMDLKAIVQNQYQEIIGQVMTYKKNLDEGGEQYNNFAVIKDCNSDKIITLNVEGTRKNQTYAFFYLKHTKIGAINKIKTEQMEKEQIGTEEHTKP